MVSSDDARRDCEGFFPQSQGSISVVPFAVQLTDDESFHDPTEILAMYGIRSRYFYLPGQLWRHKNHLAIVEALRLLRDRGKEVVVVATGNPKDRRNPSHPGNVFRAVEAAGLESRFRFLGLIPYAHIMPLMRASVALVNPSLFEGWSTTVEEAKALGVPLLLSNLRVHREQALGEVRFFDANSPTDIANVLATAWDDWEAGPNLERERMATMLYERKRSEFGIRFVEVVKLLTPAI